VEYVFDCSQALGRDDYNQVWLFFSSPDNDGEAVGHTYYIDELMGPVVHFPENYSATFSISSEKTGGKLAGITVALGDLVKQTDLQGEADFMLQEGSHSYGIRETGYFPVESTLELVKDTVLNIVLYDSTASLKFRIYSEDLPLNQAEVKIGDHQQTTNQVGIVVYEKLPRYQDYSFTINKQGYESESGLISLTGDTTLNISMQLLISAKQQGRSAIDLYPNPADSRIYLKSDRSLIRAELFTIQGTLIQTFDRKELSDALDLTGMAEGMYLLKIYPESGVPLLRRFILSRAHNSK
jgi:hypothetical protein